MHRCSSNSLKTHYGTYQNKLGLSKQVHGRSLCQCASSPGFSELGLQAVYNFLFSNLPCETIYLNYYVI